MFIMIIPTTAIMLTTTTTNLFMVSKIRQVSMQQIHQHTKYSSKKSSRRGY